MLASADTEIALLAAAQARRRAEDPAAPSLRLAPVMRLGHNFSVDLYMETVGAGAAGHRPAARRQRLLAVRRRAPGRDLPRRAASRSRCCPATTSPTRNWPQLSTVPADACRRLWRYLAEGGPANADNFLRYAGER